MKKATIILGLVVASLAIAGIANGTTFTFTPTPANMYNLDHYYFYTWGFDVSSLAGLHVLEAELFIDDITNHDNGANVLYIHLLDNAPLGVRNTWDNQGGGDAFAGQGVLIDTWHDTNGSSVRDDLHYVFSGLGLLATVSSYATDGVLAIAFDPDCHFWNEGVRLVLTAEAPSKTKDASWGSVKNLFR